MAAVLPAALTACGADAPDPVHGLKDGLRHISRQTTRATRPRMVNRCTASTVRVSHHSTTGSGSHQIRPERWCVLLDDVNGNHGRDNVRYRVDRGDYNRVQSVRHHTRATFVPTYPNTYC